MTTATFDRICECPDVDVYYGYLGNDYCEVYSLADFDSDVDLESEGLIKCTEGDKEASFAVYASEWAELTPGIVGCWPA